MLDIDQIITMALEEDIGVGDVTTDLLIGSKRVKATVVAKQKGVLSGVEIFEMVMKKVDKSLKIIAKKRDGDLFELGDTVLEIQGKKSSVLKGERVALNFLQRMCGIATETSRYVCKVHNAKIYDTRKTTPILRVLDKYAVKCGGGENHRFGLFDKILVKENHFQNNSISEIVSLIRENYDEKDFEIEVRNQEEFLEALKLEVPIIMLDNFTPDEVYESIKSIGSFKPTIEVSGNISLATVSSYDISGVDRISVGKITHSFEAVDLSLLISD